MQAERVILKTSPSGKIEKFPILPPNKKIEAIFLVLEDVVPQRTKRTPHADIAGKTKIMGNLFDTVPSE